MNNLEKNINDFHLIIFSNSPGEISSWVLPVIKTFKQKCPDSCITVFLTPCDYATGNEYDLLYKNKLVDSVYLPNETMRYVFFKKKFIASSNRGAILFLGGDPLYPQLFSIRLPFPVYGYTEQRKKLDFFYKKTFFKHIDGDLMSASIASKTFVKKEIYKKYSLEVNKYCLFMPGSRPKHFHLFMPLIVDTIKLIQAEDQDFKALISISPFISENDLAIVKTTFDYKNIFFIRGDSLELMSISRMMISLPGTNTAEAMYMNLPTLMVLPLNNPEQFVFDGLLQLFFKIPFLGSFLRYCLIKIFLIKKPLLALPNIIAKKTDYS